MNKLQVQHAREMERLGIKFLFNWYSSHGSSTYSICCERSHDLELQNNMTLIASGTVYIEFFQTAVVKGNSQHGQTI